MNSPVSAPSTRTDVGPAEGGSQVRWTALTDEPLDVLALLDVVGDPVAGGIALFVGVVRDHDHGRHVEQLTYSAHPTAADRLADVAREVGAQFPVTALAAVHRTGVLAVGDAAVIVAVSAPHRGEAYVASRALIDRLKHEVPIWKHQVFADGDEEWVGETCE